MATPSQTIARRGLMVVLSSPSGAGKSTLARTLLDPAEGVGGIKLSVSVTTRPRRPSEIEGVHYHFISERAFEQMRDHGELLEWAHVHGNFYGTPREPVYAVLEAGSDILFDIDWQGTRQLYEAARQDVVSIFVLPPSAAELRQRLERRAEDAAEVIAARLANAKAELEHWNEYDYFVVNDDLARAYAGVKAIVAAERQRRERSPGLEGFVAGLRDGL